MLIRLAWKNVWRNRLRSSIMVAAMVFGLLGVILMVGFVRAMIANMVENAIKYQTAHFQIHHPDFLENEELSAWIPGAGQIAEEISGQSGVTGVSVRQVVSGMLASAATTRGVRINGVDADSEKKVTAVGSSIVAGNMVDENGRNPILVSRRTGRKLNIKIGSKVVLTFSDINGDVSGAAFRVCGFYNTPSSGFDEGNVFVRRSDLVRYSGLAHSHEIAVRIHDDKELNVYKSIISDIAGNKGIVQDWSEVQPMLAAITGSMNISNTIMIGIFVLALGFGIVNIMLMSVFERTRELGMLMAVGMSRSNVLRLIVTEAFFLGGIGSLVGLGASSLMIAVTGKIGLPFGAMAEGLGVFGVDTVLYPEVSFATYLGTFIVLLFTSVLAALYPARQVLRKNISETLSVKN
jgi:ABC-type lipoprotein release transport system permease subunit